MRKQVFIVEGQHDAAKLKEVLGDVNVVTTNGSDISKETLNLIKKLDLTHDLIIFTDPDYAGQRIRHEVSKDLTHVYHAFLKQERAISKNKKKIGIEHAAKADILFALHHIQHAKPNQTKHITTTFLFELGLIGHKNSKKKRNILANKLNLGHVNGKTLKARLNLFQINKEQVIEVIHESSS